ncbi:MAG: Maf family protein [Verrucomicrobiae bacterium]|nr:Maf family protein [Verrucomicrobiae bacterium]
MKIKDSKSTIPSLILASASPRRRELLEEEGIPFKVCAAHVREIGWNREVKRRWGGAAAVARENARRKSLAASRRHPGKWVLGADTVVVWRGEVFGKPGDLAEAFEMLQKLNGRTHQVITGVCLACSRRVVCLAAVRSRVTFKKLTPAQIRRYLRLINPLDKAGAYAAQEHGRSIIRRVEGSWTNVVGLPMEWVRRHVLLKTLQSVHPAYSRGMNVPPKVHSDPIKGVRPCV